MESFLLSLAVACHKQVHIHGVETPVPQVLVGTSPGGCAGAPPRYSPQSGPAGVFLPVERKKHSQCKPGDSVSASCVRNWRH